MSHPHDCISAVRAKLATEPAPRPAMHANDIFTPSSALSRGVANRDGPYIMHTDARCPLVNASAATSSAGATSVPARTRGKRHRPGTTTLHAHSGGTSANLASAHANTERPRGAGPVADRIIVAPVVGPVASCVVVAPVASCVAGCVVVAPIAGCVVVVRGYTFAKARPQKSPTLNTRKSVGTNKSPRSRDDPRSGRGKHGGDDAPFAALHTELVTAGNTHRVTVNVSATARR
mmetsp:Transcript_11693/g.45383  ORF Transcript_11693/g.45383 Transcript_11693/m.45383 type:complete len:233 (-) Transcript_11693:34-732(-)